MANVPAKRTRQTNAFAASRGDKRAMRPLAKLLWTFVSDSSRHFSCVTGHRYTQNVKKLQFIHTVNGDGSKTAKIIKEQC